MILHGYFRSRRPIAAGIAFNLKGVRPDEAFVHLRKGEQASDAFLRLNPQGLVPRWRRKGGR